MADKYIVIKEGSYHGYDYKVGEVLSLERNSHLEDVLTLRTKRNKRLLVWDYEVKLLIPKNRIGGKIL